MTAEEPFAHGFAALAEGRWEQARSAFEVVLARGEAETAEARFGLAITYKSNFANFAAANGWVLRAERLLEPLDPGPIHGWLRVARAYRMTGLDEAEALTGWAVEIARAAGDVDLELTASAQLGLIQVGKGQTKAGFALIDEAMAAAVAGERLTFDTVVFACCAEVYDRIKHGAREVFAPFYR